MPKFEGDWFHSRTGSQLSELAAIQLLVASSMKTEFIGKIWGADRRNPKNAWIYDFSATAKLGNESIQPSTMQTKIRNWIRLGFIRDSNQLPLQWTTMGLLWSDAVDDGRGGDANLLYRLTIANALATVSFSPDSKRFDSIPVESGLLIKRLIEELNSNNGALDRNRLEYLIDGDTTRKKGKNYSYWTTDLVQSALFIKNYNGGLEFGNQFPNMLEAIRNYVPQPKITAQEIKNNPLALGAPFREALLSEFKEYGTPQLIDAVEGLSTFRITLSKEQLEKRWQASKQSERTSTWSKAVKNNYHYHCAIPGCDAEGTLFIQAAHIMPFSAEDIITNNKHRSDVENGVALCLSCHKMFDAGLFTFDGYGKIVPSKFIYSSELIKTEKQINVMRILDSQAKQLILPEKVHFNRVYALYHRENVFLGE
ncbi:hypothetical protein IGK38_000077 [Enterococcus pernyi]